MLHSFYPLFKSEYASYDSYLLSETAISVLGGVTNGSKCHSKL